MKDSKIGKRINLKSCNLVILQFVFILLLTTFSFSNFESIKAARVVGMGNAFTGLSNDVNAIYYNPAGIAFLKNIEITSSYNRKYIGLSDGSNIGGGYIAGVYPKSEIASIGIGYTNFHLAGFYQEHVGMLSIARKVTKDIALGVNVKFLMSGIGEDEYTKQDPLFQEKGYNTSGIGVDVAGMIRVMKQFSFGFMVKNINQPNMALSGEDKLPMEVRAGIAYRYYGIDGVLDVNYKMNDTSDIDVSFGLEKWFGRGFAIRGGFKVGARSDYDIMVGAGYRSGNFGIDYGLEYPLAGITKTYGTHKIGLSIKIGRVTPESEIEFGYEDIMLKSKHDEIVKKLEKEIGIAVKDAELLRDEIKTKEEELIAAKTDSAGMEEANQKIEEKDKEIKEKEEEVEKLNGELEIAMKKVSALEKKIKGVRKVKTYRKPIKKKPKKVEIIGLSKDRKRYRVQKGDTLRSIAKKIYKDASKWMDIYRMNESKIKRGQVEPGQELVLPRK